MIPKTRHRPGHRNDRIQDVNDACKKVEKGDARFRYVIDMASLKEEIEE